MKLHHVMFLCTLSAAVFAVFVICSQVTVSAENNADYLALQPQINELISLAVPPYKR